MSVHLGDRGNVYLIDVHILGTTLLTCQKIGGGFWCHQARPSFQECFCHRRHVRPGVHLESLVGMGGWEAGWALPAAQARRPLIAAVPLRAGGAAAARAGPARAGGARGPGQARAGHGGRAAAGPGAGRLGRGRAAAGRR